MLRQALTALLLTFARATIAYVCGEALHVLSDHLTPDAPLIAYIVLRLISRVTLALFVVRIKLIVTIRRRRSGVDDRK
jgi:hypothetical protein